jgi:dephospho-CoA kinase
MIKMIKVGLSGNRYSGKNRVVNLFKEIGIPVFDADTILRFILNYNWELLEEVRQELGSEIFQGDYLNFQEIKNPEVFNNLLKLVEPDIFRAYDKFNKKQTSIYTIFHSSILFERGWDKNMDRSVSVFSSNKDRISRCKNITKMGLLTINDLSKTEMDPLEKNRLSDYTIHNYNDESSAFGDTFNQVCKVDQKIIDTYLFNEATKRVM